MCNRTCQEFFMKRVAEDDVRGRKVLEAGSYDVNGSLRNSVMKFQPASYLGVDIEKGPGVDEVCDISRLIGRFGRSAFDVVISTEVIEHVYDWRNAILNFKGVLSAGGILIFSTRSKGFGIHGFPCDYWRFEVEDAKVIFSDMKIRALESDPSSPGIFLIAEKISPDKDWIPGGEFSLYSVILRKRCNDVSEGEIGRFMRKMRMRRRIAAILPVWLKDFIKKSLKYD